MKSIFLLVFALVFLSNEIHAECSKVVVSLAPLKIKTLASYMDDWNEELEKTKKERDNVQDDEAYKKKLDNQIEDIKRKIEKRMEHYEKYYKSYGKLRTLLLDKFNNNRDLVMTYMSTSPGIKLQETRRGGQSDYMLQCSYSPSMTPPNNDYWDKFRGFLYCKLIDVESGEIIWISERKDMILGKYDTSSENMFRIAWNHILNKIPRSSELEKIIRVNHDYKIANLDYSFDNEAKRLANGKETGELKVSNILQTIRWGNPRPRNIAEFKLESKQGEFTRTGTKESVFIPKDYKESKSFKAKYKTYNCNEKGIQDKLFETFTLKRTCLMGQEEDTFMKEIQVPFECEEPFYTVTTTKRITSKVKALENYRGISKDLKSYQEDKSVYYIYVDAPNAKIIQYHVNNKSTRKIHRESYELNLDTCNYEIKKKDKLVKSMSGPRILKSKDEGWGLEDDSKIYVSLPDSKKSLYFIWGDLRESGHFSASRKYKKEIPKIVKDFMGQFTQMAKLFRDESKNSKEIEIFKSLYDYPGTPIEVQCGGKVSMETLLIPPLDALQDPEVEFSIKIRPSREDEIKVLKKKNIN